jgi:hypothetical protein
VGKYGNNLDTGWLRTRCLEYLDLRGKMTIEWIKLHNDELHNLYIFSNIGMIKLRRMSWMGRLTYRRGGEGHIKFCCKT